MFFDVTRAGTDRPLRVAVAAIAYLDTLAAGCVLHLVGGQGLQVAEDAVEVEARALAAAAPVADLQPASPFAAGSMMAATFRELLERGGIDPVTEPATAELADEPPPSDPSEPPAPAEMPTTKARRRRGQPR